MTPGPTFFIPTAGTWSGGGTAVLKNFAHAAERHRRLSFDDGEVTVVNRNVLNRRPRGPYVLVPQNAWPWAGPKLGLQERAKLIALRTASELAMRLARGVIRVGKSIPDIGHTHATLLPNPLDPDFEVAVVGVDGSPSPSDSPYFASIGSINSYRGIETLLTAYDMYRHEGGRTLLVIGGGAKAHYLRLIESQSASIEGVELRPQGLSRHECLTMLHHARIAVLPSHVEASPFSLLEALAVQRNVAASDIAGHRGIVPPGTDHPQYFTHRDPETLTRLFHAADQMADLGPLHALAFADFREDARARWGDTLVSMLDDLIAEAG